MTANTPQGPAQATEAVQGRVGARPGAGPGREPYWAECDGPGHEWVRMASDDKPPEELVGMFLLAHTGHTWRTGGIDI